jgi:outer membrane protein assembly factor BamB
MVWLTAPCTAENWPCFRGPTGQGISSAKGLPLTWSLKENLAWQVEVPGVGWSSPVVWGNRLFLTTATEQGISCHALCFDADNGKLLWDEEVVRQVPQKTRPKNSQATPTPVTDGKLLYVAFNGGRLAALDFDGKIAWSRQDIAFFSIHGLGASPILHKDMLIMPFDGNDEKDSKRGFKQAWEGAFVAAFDKQTGKDRWRGRRGLSRQGHVTPMVIDVGGKPLLISAGGDVVQAFNADTGELIWTVKSQGEGVVPSIVYGQGLVYTASGYEAPAMRAIKPDGKGDVTATHIAWESRDTVSMMPSFLYTDGLLFCVKETGIAVCLDAANGKLLWRERLGGAYSASPVLAEGRIYCLAEDGATVVIAAAREYKELARNPLEGLCQASPAFAGGQIFIRAQGKLYCVANKKRVP